MKIIEFFNKLKQEFPKGNLKVSAPTPTADGFYTVNATIEGNEFVVKWKPGSMLQLQRVGGLPTVLGMNNDTPKWFTTTDDALRFIIECVAKTPTTVGTVASLWLAIRPYVIWIVPVKWRNP